MFDVFTTDVDQSKKISSRKRAASDYEYITNKQPKLNNFIDNRKPMTKDRFEKLVVDTIVDAHLSAQVVENASFKALLDAGFHGFEIHRTTVGDRITRKYNSMIEEMVKMFENIQYVCLTADCWTSYRRY
jgi:spore germination protein YaaH